MNATTIRHNGLLVPAVVARLAGSIMPSLTHQIELSSWLRLEIYEPGPQGIVEETGRLVCLPVNDEAFGLQRSEARDTILLLHVHPQFLAQWPASLLHDEQAFRFDHAAEHELRGM